MSYKLIRKCNKMKIQWCVQDIQTNQNKTKYYNIGRTVVFQKLKRQRISLR